MKRFRFKLLLITLTFIGISSLLQSQDQIIFKSNYLKSADTVLVFTPKVKNPNGDPALYLLHGWSGNYSNWSKKTDLQSFSDKYGFIIITPDGFYDSWYLNNIDTNKMQWRTFFHEELYPILKKRYNLSEEKTFITGLSMGGHGAITTFLSDTTKFRAAGSMSGVLSLSEELLKNERPRGLLEQYSKEFKDFEKETAINKLSNAAGGSKILLLTTGAQDVYATCTIETAKRADELKIKNILILSPGAHKWNYWIYALDQHLWYFSKIVNGENLGW